MKKYGDKPSVTDPTVWVSFTWRRKQIQVPKRSVLFVEYRTMDRAEKTTNVDCNASSSVPFRIVQLNVCLKIDRDLFESYVK
jgi:hypothetical protein